MGYCLACSKKTKDRSGRPPSKFCSIGCKKSYHRVEKNCLTCDSPFAVTLARRDSAKFCSTACANENQTVHKKVTRSCSNCGEDVMQTKDNRLSSKVFCNRDCFISHSNSPINKKCLCCELDFKSKFRSERQKYEVYCSKLCKNKHQIGERSPRYSKSGKYTLESGIAYVRTESGWRLEHRSSVEAEIGRKLNYKSEPVLHINGNNSDNRVENLYVCRDYSEMGKILKSYDAPYPVESNLNSLPNQGK